MATKPTVVENINVLQVGKFGVRVDEKTWFGVNEPLTPEHFTKNTGYKVSVVVSKTGKKYIQEIIGVDTAAEEAPAAVAAPVAKAATESTPAPKAQSESAAPKFDDKTIQIQRQGLYQAALQSPALAQWAVNTAEYLALVRQAADAGVAYVREGK